MNTEQERSRERTLPIQELLTERYNDVLLTARKVVDAVLEKSVHLGKYRVCEVADFESIVSSASEQFDYGAAFEGMGAVQLIDGVMRLQPDFKLEGRWAQAFIVEYLRHQPNKDFTLDKWKAYHDTLDTVLESASVPNTPHVLPADRRDIFALALDAGLLVNSTDDPSRVRGSSTAHTLRPAQRMDVMAITELMRRSYSVPGVTSGWDQLVIDPEHVKKMNIPRRSWLQPSVLIDADGVKRIELLSVGQQPKRAPVFVKEWRYAKDQQSEVRDDVLLALLDSYEQALELQVAKLPEGIRLQTVEALSHALAERGITSLRSPRELGYIVPAYQTDDNNQPVHKRFRTTESEVAERNACYFVSLSKQAMRDWIGSAEYRQWMESDQLNTEWRIRWETELNKHIVSQATFLPEEVQPVYLVTRNGVDAAEAIVPRRKDGNLMLAQRARQIGPDNLFLYFPNPKQYHRYRKMLGDSLTDNEILDNQADQMIHWRVNQLMHSEQWNQWEVITTTDGEQLRYIPMDELQSVLATMPPLTTTNLRGKGYLLDAQVYRARSGNGGLLFCPDGSTQQERIKGSNWYSSFLKRKGR